MIIREFDRSFLDSAPDFYFKIGDMPRHRRELAFRRWRYACILYGRAHPVAERYWNLWKERQRATKN